jgi:hypothetical protein
MNAPVIANEPAISRLLEDRCELAAILVEHAATIDRMLRELLGAHERLLQTRAKIEATNVTALGREASESGVMPIEMPPSIWALETIHNDMSRIETVIDTGIASIVRDLSGISVTLRCVMGRIVAEPLTASKPT